jgi:hypothetical protein
MDGPPIWQRLLAALAYTLPWSDALEFGKPLLSQFPVLNLLVLPALPILRFEQLFSVGGFGLGGLLLFLLLYGAVVRNPQVPYTVRFNVLLALMIDILLVVLQLAMEILFRQIFGTNLLLRTNTSGLPGIRLSGADPGLGEARLPHHISLLVSDPAGQPLAGRRLVHALWQEGWAVGSGSACSSAGAGAAAGAASPVLRALGHDAAVAGSGLRISLGSWHRDADLEELPAALQRARSRVGGAPG